MILHGRDGKTLLYWMESDGIELRMRGPAGVLDWADIFPNEEALLFLLTAASEIALRLQYSARQSAPAAVSTP